jgi:hypothetical protein
MVLLMECKSHAGKSWTFSKSNFVWETGLKDVHVTTYSESPVYNSPYGVVASGLYLHMILGMFPEASGVFKFCDLFDAFVV